MSLLWQGLIISLKDGEGIIKSEKHGELPFDLKENFSDVEFTAEDVNEEVEFTVAMVRPPHSCLRGRAVQVLVTLSSKTTVSSAEIRESGHQDQTGEGASPPDNLLGCCCLCQQKGRRSGR